MVTRAESQLSIDELVVGRTAHDSLYDDQGVLLVAEGVQITTSLVEKLRRRGVKTLFGGPTRIDSAATATATTTTRPPARRQRRIQTLNAIVPGASPHYSAKKVERIKDQFSAGERAVSYLYQAIRRSGAQNLRRTDVHVEDYIRELVDDPDPVIANALAYEADLELAHRCVQFSVLSMAIAQQMDIPAAQLRELGSAAMVHDWSLFDLPPYSRFPHQKMTEQTRAEYRVHPIATVEMLHRVRDVAAEIKVLVSQVHEHLDGSGFPNRVSADQLHPLSRILCVADAYLTMTSPPKGSPRIVPCDAIVFLINGASQGMYSPKAVTGLLQAVTLYPIGSIVELSDATKARVIRANGKDYGYPIVESLADASRMINLKEAELFVTRPILSAQFREVRLPETHTQLDDAIARI